MLSKREKDFLKVFNIKPIYYRYHLVDKSTRKLNEKLLNREAFIDFVKSDKPYVLLDVNKKYPKFTAERILQLLCIIYKTGIYTNSPRFVEAPDIETLKDNILKRLTTDQKYFADHPKYKALEIAKLVQEVFNEN